LIIKRIGVFRRLFGMKSLPQRATSVDGEEV
jgi:hypothetical protein